MKHKGLTKEQLVEQIHTLQDRINSLEKTVAAQSQAENALSISEKNLSAILEMNADGIVIVDADGTVLYVNPPAEKLFGKRKEDFLGYPFGFPVSADKAEASLIIRKGDTLCDAELRVVQVQWQKRPAFQLSVRDITERRTIEEKVRNLNAQLQDSISKLEVSNKELESFSYSVAHDLRAPLRHISGFIKLLQKSLEGRLDEKSNSHMTTISRATEKMNTLIDDLLSFSRMARTEMRMRKVSIDILVRESIKDMAEDVEGRDIVWKIGELPNAYGDRALLKLVIFNLISNAVKFTRTRDHTEIEIGCKKEKEEFVFFIKDNGVGFNMEHASELFGVFQRLHTQEEFEGTGIGLANVQRIVGRHGGKTWAEGSIGQGATFYFTLPKARES